MRAAADQPFAATRILAANLHLIGLREKDPDNSICLCAKELFENALAACDDGRAGAHSIRLRVEGVPGSSRLYRVCVSDDGRGFGGNVLDRPDVLQLGTESWASLLTGTSASHVDQALPRGLLAVLLWANHSYWSSQAELGGTDEHPSPHAIVEIASVRMRPMPSYSPRPPASAHCKALVDV